MKKLHLGCGNKRIPGYLNIDIIPGPAVDMVADLRDLSLEKESFDVIYACAVLEHFGRHEWVNLIEHWTGFLKPKGKLFISTTDFESVVEQYQNKKNLDELLGFLIGGQKTDYDWHGMIFNFDILKSALEAVGYEDVHRYDWKDFDVGTLNIDDYSQAYLPHMDKENGKLMVLNICATKR